MKPDWKLNCLHTRMGPWTSQKHACNAVHDHVTRSRHALGQVGLQCSWPLPGATCPVSWGPQDRCSGLQQALPWLSQACPRALVGLQGRAQRHTLVPRGAQPSSTCSPPELLAACCGFFAATTCAETTSTSSHQSPGPRGLSTAAKMPHRLCDTLHKSPNTPAVHMGGIHNQPHAHTPPLLSWQQRTSCYAAAGCELLCAPHATRALPLQAMGRWVAVGWQQQQQQRWQGGHVSTHQQSVQHTRHRYKVPCGCPSSSSHQLMPRKKSTACAHNTPHIHSLP